MDMQEKCINEYLSEKGTHIHNSQADGMKSNSILFSEG